MKRTLIVAAIVLGFICTAFSAEKINIQIVYDCSGSMGGKTEGGSGKQKAEVAKTAMSGIVRMISQFVKASPNTEINIGIVSFRGGKNGVILPLEKFDSVKVNQAVENLPCDNSLYAIDDNGRNWFKENAGTYSGTWKEFLEKGK